MDAVCDVIANRENAIYGQNQANAHNYFHQDGCSSIVGCRLGAETLEGAREDANCGECGEREECEWLDIDTLGVGGGE